MNKPVLYTILILSNICISQNLLPNGNFEFYSSCPSDHDQVYKAIPWYKPNSNTSDYFNACFQPPSVVLDVGVPVNGVGYQEAHSGNGYCGLGFEPPFSYYEYIASPLSEPLKAGTNYCVSMWVSLADTFCLAVNKLGILFSNDSIYSALNHINVVPDIQFDEVVNNKGEWMNLSTTYLASGGEQYLSIGIFDSLGMDTSIVCMTAPWEAGTYLYIDDVSVVEDMHNNSCSTAEHEYEIPNIFTPNGDESNDYFLCQFDNELDYIYIVNRWGNSIITLNSTNPSWDGRIDGVDVSEGVYFYKAFIKGKYKTGFIHLVR